MKFLLNELSNIEMAWQGIVKKVSANGLRKADNEFNID